METEIVENLEFTFTPEIKIIEGKEKGDWVQIGGTALAVGESRNKNFYSLENLKENNGREFKWIVGHPDDAEEHIVGLGSLTIEGKTLHHEGRIRNTKRHPDVVEAVKDGFLGPSIHASCEKVTRKEGVYHIEGLEIDGVGLVAFQGVRSASIDYALAESFDKKLFDKTEGKKQETRGEATMAEEEEKPAETPAPEAEKPAETPKEEPAKEEPKEEEKPAEEPKEESVSVEDFKKLQEELKSLKEKTAEKESAAIVEEDEAEKKDEDVVESNGSMTLSPKKYDEFNKELKERVI